LQSKLFFRRGDPSALHQAARTAGPFFAWRTQFLVQIPSGSFNPARSSNIGSGYGAVVPYLAATLLPLSGLEMSTRVHYHYNLATTRIANPPPIPHLVYRNGKARETQLYLGPGGGFDFNSGNTLNIKPPLEAGSPQHGQRTLPATALHPTVLGIRTHRMERFADR
jgi:hypothetical protein